MIEWSSSTTPKHCALAEWNMKRQPVETALGADGFICRIWTLNLSDAPQHSPLLSAAPQVSRDASVRQLITRVALGGDEGRSLGWSDSCLCRVVARRRLPLGARQDDANGRLSEPLRVVCRTVYLRNFKPGFGASETNPRFAPSQQAAQSCKSLREDEILLEKTFLFGAVLFDRSGDALESLRRICLTPCFQACRQVTLDGWVSS